MRHVLQPVALHQAVQFPQRELIWGVHDEDVPAVEIIVSLHTSLAELFVHLEV